MILIVTNKLDPHADAVIQHLRTAGRPFLRFNTEDFPSKVQFSLIMSPEPSGRLFIPQQPPISISEISSCWYRRPLPPTISKDLLTEQTKDFARSESEAFLRDLEAYFPILLWLNSPSKIKEAENKMSNLKVAHEVGFKIAKTLVTTDPSEARKFLTGSQNLFINKVLGKGSVEYMKDYYFIYTHKVNLKDLNQLENVKYAPTLFQEYVPKKIEIRTTIVGDKIFSCEIHSQDSEKTLIDWRHYDFDNVEHRIHQLPQDIEGLCLKITRFLGLSYAAIDLVLTPNNEYIFLEINPNGQWLWVEDLTGLPISLAIAKTLIDIDQKNEKQKAI